MADPKLLSVTLPAGSVIEHNGQQYQLMHASQVIPGGIGGVAADITPRPRSPVTGGAVAVDRVMQCSADYLDLRPQRCRYAEPA